ncbi:hypothetical protein GGR26_001708 [Lewinella marina]|uniref:hypothetical protein n=1 Tax=Neolewinella marina TaxID=438751 RepID=UPI00117BA6E8|nr:hypothetical protein [Neolewinella marina]NJB85940.1 hypothetical protein [Neolewinella marina]
MTKEMTFWLILEVVVGCKSTGSVAGYYYSDTTSLNNQTLFLKENGGFRYDLSVELSDAESSGSWRLQGSKEIILTSNDSLRSGIVYSVERTDGSKHSFSIKLTDARGEPLPHATVTVNKKKDSMLTILDMEPIKLKV